MLMKGILLSRKLPISIFSMNYFKTQVIFKTFNITIKAIQSKNLLLLYNIHYLNMSLYCPRSDEGCEHKGQHFLSYTDNSVWVPLLRAKL